MTVIDECGMLVDELWDDAVFVDALAGLRDVITDAITTADTRGKSSRFGDVAERLVGIIERLERQR